MAKRRCSLCGGRLSDNKCTLCGLDNSIYQREREMILSYNDSRQKQDSRYMAQPHKTDNGRQRQIQQKTHNPRGRVSSLSGTNAPQRTAPPRRPQPQKARSSRRSPAVITAVVILLIAALSLLQPLLRIGRSLLDKLDSFESDSYVSYDDTYDNYEYWDPYEYVTEEIPETGDSFDTVIGYGTYIVGIHIPEGVYTAELIAGDGFLVAEHEEYFLYDSIYFGTDSAYDQVTEREDFRLYNGEIIDLDSRLIVRLTTENAQPLEQEPQENPLSDPVTLEPGVYTVDNDAVPQGIFDISADTSDPDAYANVILTYPNGTSEYYWVDSTYAITSEEYSDPSARNIVFPAGTDVTVEYGDVVLTPSEVYYDVDYSQYSE